MDEDFLGRSWPLSGGVVGKPFDFPFLYICISIEPSCLFGLSPFLFCTSSQRTLTIVGKNLS